MFGTYTFVVEIDVPAKDSWAIYGTLHLIKVAVPNFVASVKVLEGNGEQGTRVLTTHSSGLFHSYEERFIKVDDKNMVKESEIYKGGYRELGFNSYVVRFEVSEKTKVSSSVKTTIEFDVKDEFVANISYITVQGMMDLVKAAATYLEANCKT